MRHLVSHTPDKIKTPPKTVIHQIFEFFRMQECNQIVLIGHDESLIHGIHPLDGKFHGTPAVDNAG